MACRRRLSPARSSGSFLRKPGQKPPRSTTLIVCEGETEQLYFNAVRIRYRLTTAEVVLAENTIGSAPISVVACAEQKGREAGGYDAIFCVFDKNGHQSFEKARARIATLARRKRRSLPIREAVSIPCFELWVLLHFEQTDRPFRDCAGVISYIRRNHYEAYQKADPTATRELMPRLDVAINRAVALAARAEDNNYNPYTSVYQILQHLAAVAEQEER